MVAVVMMMMMRRFERNEPKASMVVVPRCRWRRLLAYNPTLRSVTVHQCVAVRSVFFFQSFSSLPRGFFPCGFVSLPETATSCDSNYVWSYFAVRCWILLIIKQSWRVERTVFLSIWQCNSIPFARNTLVANMNSQVSLHWQKVLSLKLLNYLPASQFETVQFRNPFGDVFEPRHHYKR